MSENDELKPMEEVLEVSPTLRGRLMEIFGLVVLGLIFLKLFKMVPPQGLSIYDIFGLKFLPIFTQKIPAAYLQNPLRILCLGSVIYGLYVYLQQKLTVYKLTYLYIQKNSGVFYRTSDSTDLTSVRDQRKTRNLVEMALGLSKMIITSNDVSDPEMIIKGITNDDAEKIINFLRKYAFRSYTDYRIARDKEKSKKPTSRDHAISDEGDFE